MPEARLRVAADIRATFTDVVAFDATTRRVMLGKALTSPLRPARGLADALAKAAVAWSHARSFHLASTIARDALVERSGARTALGASAPDGRPLAGRCRPLPDPGRPPRDRGAPCARARAQGPGGGHLPSRSDGRHGAGRAKAAQSDMVLPRTWLRSTLQAAASVPARWVRSDCLGPFGADVSLPIGSFPCGRHCVGQGQASMAGGHPRRRLRRACRLRPGTVGGWRWPSRE